MGKRKCPEDLKNSGLDLSVQPIPTRKDKIEQPILAESDVIPRVNSSMLFIGHSGSGKTTLLVNMLTRKDMYRGTFDEVYLISPTCRSDDVQKHLDLDEEFLIDDLSEAPDLLDALMLTARDEIEAEGAHKAPVRCIIFDDVIADRDLMKSSAFVKCFIACRHYNFTTMICSQSFKSVPKKCRLQANNIFFFRGSNSEAEGIMEDRCPPHMNRKQGLAMVEYATKEPYSFLHINMRKPFEERYARNLDSVIRYTIQRDAKFTKAQQEKKDGSDEKGKGSTRAC